MKHSEQINELATALAKAQGAIKGAKKDSTNPAFNSKYADLASVVDACKEALAANGLSYVQMPVTTDKDEIGVETILMHSSGQWIAGEPYYMPVVKTSAHGFGSILTYARRYALTSLLGIAPEDDDANEGVKDVPRKADSARQVTVDEFAGMSDEMQDYLRTHATAITALFNSDKPMLDYIDKQKFDTESKLALWSLLSAPIRAEIKREQAADRLSKQPRKGNQMFTPAELGSQG